MRGKQAKLLRKAIYNSLKKKTDYHENSKSVPVNVAGTSMMVPRSSRYAVGYRGLYRHLKQFFKNNFEMSTTQIINKFKEQYGTAIAAVSGN